MGRQYNLQLIWEFICKITVWGILISSTYEHVKPSETQSGKSLGHLVPYCQLLLTGNSGSSPGSRAKMSSSTR